MQVHVRYLSQGPIVLEQITRRHERSRHSAGRFSYLCFLAYHEE